MFLSKRKTSITLILFFVFLFLLFLFSCHSVFHEGLSTMDYIFRTQKEFISNNNLRNKFVTHADETTKAQTLMLYEYATATSEPTISTFGDPRPITNEYGKTAQFFDMSASTLSKAELIVQNKEITAIRLRKNAQTTLFTSPDFRELKEEDDNANIPQLEYSPLLTTEPPKSELLLNPFNPVNVSSIDNNYILKTKLVPCVQTKVNTIFSSDNNYNNNPVLDKIQQQQNDMLPKLLKEELLVTKTDETLVQNKFKNPFQSILNQMEKTVKKKNDITFDISSFSCPNSAYDCNGSGHPNSIK